jgi:two-component system, OmpR family, sensor kinase
MWWWRGFLPNARIRVRIIAAVVVAMTVVLVLAGGFVYWRVSYALDRQLNQDLRAYTDLVTGEVRAGDRLPADKPGLVSQTFATDGRVLDKSDGGVRTLLTDHQIRSATSRPRRLEVGRFLPPPGKTPYRVRYFTTPTPQGTVVVATAISRHKHDEALRELMLQLCLADLAAIAAAGLVGWGATRAALDPVERYRRAAAAAGGDPRRRLPVDTGRDDELTRLGTTLNTLLAEIEHGQSRERQFLADASHELRSPLALLAAEVEWARARPRTTEEVETVLASVAGQVQQLASLSDALLDLEEAKGRRQDAVVVPLHDLLVGAVAQPSKLAKAVGRNVVLDAPAIAIRVDRAWMELAVANLVTNAVKHGKGTVTVTGRTVDGSVRISVTDEGDGVPATLGDKAFDRFTRGDTTRSTPGNGLGLALVRAVAERHAGHAQVIEGGVRIEFPVR